MITLNCQELIFMLSSLPVSDEQKSQIYQAVEKLSAEIPDELADSLRDLCTERLDTHGFDAKYEPTPEGKILENLIDKLFIG